MTTRLVASVDASLPTRQGFVTPVMSTYTSSVISV